MGVREAVGQVDEALYDDPEPNAQPPGTQTGGLCSIAIIPIITNIVANAVVQVCSLPGAGGIVASAVCFLISLVFAIIMRKPPSLEGGCECLKVITREWRIFNLVMAIGLMLLFIASAVCVALWVLYEAAVGLTWNILTFMLLYWLIGWNILKRWEARHWSTLYGVKPTWLLWRWWTIPIHLVIATAQILIQFFLLDALGWMAIAGIMLGTWVVSACIWSCLFTLQARMIAKAASAWAQVRRAAGAFRGFLPDGVWTPQATPFAQVEPSQQPFLQTLGERGGPDLAQWSWVGEGLRRAADSVGAGAVGVGVYLDGVAKVGDPQAMARFCNWVYTREIFVYPVINAMLRGAEEAAYSPTARGPVKPLEEDLAPFACCLLWAMRLLARPAGVPQQLWRGYRGDRDDFVEYGGVASATIVYPAFTSTSSNLDAALKFATPRHGMRGILLKIVVPPLHEPVVCDVGACSMFRGEAEFVCLPGCAFRVTRVSSADPEPAEIAGYVPEAALAGVGNAGLLGFVELALHEAASSWRL